MRKISKSRTEDDVVSSTNGSLLNDGANNKEKDKKIEDSDDDMIDKDEESQISLDTPKKSKVKPKNKKKNLSKEKDLDDFEDNIEEDSDNDDDSDFSEDTAKKSKAKSKNKKKKSNKEKEEEEYEVEKVVDCKKIKGRVHYLIRWKGYDADSDTWEPENTLSCDELINKYNEEKENSKNKTKQNKAPKKGTKRKNKKEVSKTPSKKLKTNWDSSTAQENAEYEVERILEVHHKKSGKREFLIHWKGWSNKFDSWEPESNLNCPELIKKFMDKVSVARITESRNLRVAPETTNRFTLQAPSSGRRLSKRRGQQQRVRYDNAE